MNKIRSDASEVNSTEEELNKLQAKIAKMSIKLMVGIIFFISTLAWLSLYKIIINLVIVVAPLLLLYCLLFVRWIRNYDRVMTEYRNLEKKHRREKSRREILKSFEDEFLFFRRN